MPLTLTEQLGVLTVPKAQSPGSVKVVSEDVVEISAVLAV